MSFRDLLGTVDASTDLQNLRSLAGLSEEEAAEYERLKEKVVALQSSDPSAALKQTAQDVAVLAEAEKAFSAVKNLDFELWHERLATLQQTTQAYIDSGLKDFEAPTRGGQIEEWREFIEAGEKLIQTLDGEYPVDGSECIYCGQELDEEASDRANALKKATIAASEYQARSDLEGLLDEIEKTVAAAAWVKNAQIILGRFRGTLRSLTDAAKAASNEILNEGFIARFNEECRRLHAPPIKLSFPGGDARVERKKSISDRYSISQILSEGEQKAIALADFLAESRLRTSSSPIVFDDPVNSLDYKRIGYVAERLAELSEDRQTIVFTHNIWFASEK